MSDVASSRRKRQVQMQAGVSAVPEHLAAPLHIDNFNEFRSLSRGGRRNPEDVTRLLKPQQWCLFSIDEGGTSRGTKR